MILPAAIAIVSASRVAIRVHRGVRDDEGAPLAMAFVGALLLRNYYHRHLNPKATRESSPRPAHGARHRRTDHEGYREP